MPEFCVVDADAGTIHQMWRASGDSDRERREVALRDEIAATAITSLTVATTRH